MSGIVRLVRSRVANKLRAMATYLDGLEAVDAHTHRDIVQGMNRYIGQTERYIVALEELIHKQDRCVACGVALWPSEAAPHCLDCHPCGEDVEFETLDQLRDKHGRFDTSGLVQAGAWKE